MATVWFYSVAEGLAHAFMQAPCRSMCGMASWDRALFRSIDGDAHCADCEADVRTEGLAVEAKRVAEIEQPLSELELRYRWGDR